MLYLLTGEIQIGKTRWLQARCARWADEGRNVAGVIAPGVWRPTGDAARPYEKLGIDNVLLPAGERVHLARRRDLAEAAGTLQADSQSERAHLAWAMDDGALERVDRHFAWLAADPAHGTETHPAADDGILVVDELGRLELMRGEGLVHALALLRQGPRPGWPDALAVVRRDLLPLAHEQLDDAWDGNVREIGPS